MICNDKRVSVVATVLNEYENLPAWLAGIARQSLSADEIIVIDGGSTDGTWELLQGWEPGTLKLVVRAAGCSIAEGRNLGIQHASGEIVAVTDAGTVADPDWLERLLEPFDDIQVDVVSGFFASAAESLWTRTLAAATLPDAVEVDSRRFLPSSRSVAFRRSWFDAGCRYPEWLDYCEDIVFDLQLKRAGATFRFVPDAVVHFRPRSTPRSFLLQYFRYARGDGKSGLYLGRHAIRYLTYLAAVVVLLRGRRHEMAVVAIAGLWRLRKPFQRLQRRRQAPAARWGVLPAMLLVALQIVMGDVAKMSGYPAGVVWRMRRYGLKGLRASWRGISATGALWRPEKP